MYIHWGRTSPIMLQGLTLKFMPPLFAAAPVPPSINDDHSLSYELRVKHSLKALIQYTCHYKMKTHWITIGDWYCVSLTQVNYCPSYFYYNLLQNSSRDTHISCQMSYVALKQDFTTTKSSHQGRIEDFGWREPKWSFLTRDAESWQWEICLNHVGIFGLKFVFSSYPV